MIDRTPPRRIALGAGGVAAVSVVGLALVPVAAVAATGGALLVTAGTERSSRRILGVGSLVQFVAVMVAGGANLPPGPLLIGLAGAVLGWDAGEQAINVTEQVGADAALLRPIVVHVAASALVGATAFAGVYAAYVASAGGQPLLALVLFLFGAGGVLSAMQT